MATDKHALGRALLELEGAIVDSVAIYKELLNKTLCETGQLKSLETESLRNVIDSKTALSHRAALIEKRRQRAASRVADNLGITQNATLAEILASLPNGVGRTLDQASEELSTTVAELRATNNRNRSVAEYGIGLMSSLISGLATIHVPGVAYSDAGSSVQASKLPIIEIAG